VNDTCDQYKNGQRCGAIATHEVPSKSTAVLGALHFCKRHAIARDRFAGQRGDERRTQPIDRLRGKS
jgi:hypothetical protein